MSDDYDLTHHACTHCGCEGFQVWSLWGIWYAVCSNCYTEFILAPKGFFSEHRDPGDEYC